MKKFILSLAVVLCAAGVSAQTKLGAVTDSKNWAVGARLGSGFQAVAEYKFQSENYLEARFGMSWCNKGANLMADATLLYNWHLCDMDWTPDTGKWFFDAGCGVAVGGRAHYAYFGFAGCAKFGIEFDDVPLTLSIDWTPYIGPGIAYGIQEPTFTWVDMLDPDNNIIPDPVTGNPMQEPKQTGFKKKSYSEFNEYGLVNFGISLVYRF